MANNYHGKTILGELMDNVTIANADSTQAVYVGKETGGRLWVEVYVGDTALAMADTDVVTFTLQTDDAGTLGDCEAPITTSNAGGKVGATGTDEHIATHIAADGATYGWSITATTGGITFAVGDLICEIAVPDTMMRLAGTQYVQLKTTQSGDPTGTIDAFVVARI